MFFKRGNLFFNSLFGSTVLFSSSMVPKWRVAGEDFLLGKIISYRWDKHSFLHMVLTFGAYYMISTPMVKCFFHGHVAVLAQCSWYGAVQEAACLVCPGFGTGENTSSSPSCVGHWLSNL